MSSIFLVIILENTGFEPVKRCPLGVSARHYSLTLCSNIIPYWSTLSLCSYPEVTHYQENVLQYDRSYRSTDLPLLATAPQFPVNLHLWSGKDPHRPCLREQVILGEGLLGLDLPNLRLLPYWSTLSRTSLRTGLSPAEMSFNIVLLYSSIPKSSVNSLMSSS